ncbi:hypothetical protein [Brevundimonas sp. GCM10030266]|uniref:hypothetical protein n=1 Tax=Brevundimonas sp. GCM10030266 TaxID=3273386 RepID=UPI00361BC2B2
MLTALALSLALMTGSGEPEDFRIPVLEGATPFTPCNSPRDNVQVFCFEANEPDAREVADRYLAWLRAQGLEIVPYPEADAGFLNRALADRIMNDEAAQIEYLASGRGDPFVGSINAVRLIDPETSRLTVILAFEVTSMRQALLDIRAPAPTGEQADAPPPAAPRAPGRPSPASGE